ncbi:LolA family protein [Flavobacterium caeni]|nr:outer membrane lipoprotein carrier protein LolA [Flavobacterium caeni]
MKIKTILFAFLAMICLPVVAQEQKMTEAEAASFRQSVNVVSKKITSLATDFTQFKHMDFLTKDIETSGKMFFKEPDKLLWQYKKPYNYTIVFKNGKILINDEGKKSAMDVGSSKIFAKLNKLIVGSVSGNLFDDKEFAITCYKGKDFNIAKLIPKDATLKKYLKQIELHFDKQEHTVSQVRLVESAEDYTKIVFKNKVLNAKVDDAVFVN